MGAAPTRAPYVKRLVTGGVMVTAVIVDFHRTQEGRPAHATQLF